MMNQSEEDINRWCGENSLRITKTDRDLMFPNWIWITGVRI